jgi:DNA-binding NarL/FixJ family response regulator
MKPINISITDDDPNWLKAIFYCLKELKVSQDIKLTMSGTELICYSQMEQIDIAIIDYKMPVINGIQTALLLRESNFTGKIIIISSGYSSNVKSRMNDLNLDGYLEKRLPLISNAILKIINNESILHCCDFTAWDYRTIDNNLNKLDYHYIDTILNKREKVIISYASMGYSNLQIAEKVMVSEKTIESCFTKLFEKLKMDKKRLLIWATLSGLSNSESILKNY